MICKKDGMEISFHMNQFMSFLVMKSVVEVIMNLY